MAPKKGVGASKGKQPARKAPTKRPAVELLDSDDEGSKEDQRILLQ